MDETTGNERTGELLRTLSVEELLLLHEVEPPSAAGFDERVPVVTHVDDRLHFGVSLRDTASELFRRAALDHGKSVALDDLFTSLKYASNLLLLEEEQRKLFQKLMFGASEKGFIREDEFVEAFLRWLVWIHENEDVSQVALPRAPQHSDIGQDIVSNAFADHHGNARKRFVEALQKELPQLCASAKGKKSGAKKSNKKLAKEASTESEISLTGKQSRKPNKATSKSPLTPAATNRIPDSSRPSRAPSRATSSRSLADPKTTAAEAYRRETWLGGNKGSCTNAQRVAAMRAMGKNCKVWHDFPAIKRPTQV